MKVCVLLALLLGTLDQLKADTPLIQQEPTEELVIYNRILARVNGKTLSVIDIVKKMDLFLQKHYPDLANATVARYQFFSTHWKEYLTQMIDTELMIADAEVLEVKVSDSEVREEILSRFGPNVMPALDKLGILYDEAKTLIHDELLVQKMIWFRVHAKALSRVNSQDVKTAYKHYVEKHPEMQEWHYQVLSIRSPDQTSSGALATKALELLESKTPLQTVLEKIQSMSDTASVSLSPDIESDDRGISSSHREVLQTLKKGAYSTPIAQLSKSDNSTVYRIFYLKDHRQKSVPPFEKMADQLKDELLQQAANKENTHYLLKLRERLGYDEKHMTETLPADFQPFALR